ncbi:endonuclease 8-like 1 [Hyla sarda]|uniref:endonuclease 8-like 1 n=1 Tax=Hyla sarda TaxID=327740 RepID=UPI0024C38B38|nr:endonuclease 8-like 1 [Hyla sarda]XP_056428567.1 endonuclease 8-like 1 [Hyla sarda]
MPEGPELLLASVYVNKVCNGLRFGGKVEKSEVSKNPEVPFSCPEYTISAVSRGKEMKLLLTPADEASEAACVVFRFGMSGGFKMATEDEIPKHAHLRFYSLDKPRKVLCFVDPRRFGSWHYNGTWQLERGPCVMTEHDQFRENVLNHLSDKPFDKPICEVMLNQKYFNGIGNYLRSEILFRLKTPPFMPARTVLESIKNLKQKEGLSLSKKVKIKKENPDLLQLCYLVPMEVIKLGGKGYDPWHTGEYSVLVKWFQCYSVPGMKSLRDSNGRTVWFQGEPGPCAPKGKKVRKQRKSMDTDVKPIKVETKATKRKAPRDKSIAVKKESEDEVKVEEGETAVKRKRSKMVKDSTEDTKIRNLGERGKRGKKTVTDPEVKIGRGQSRRDSMSKTPSKRGKATKQQSEEVLTPKARPRRLKADVGSQPRNSPKMKPRTRKSAVRTAKS